jgi:hypothetical protein
MSEHRDQIIGQRARRREDRTAIEIGAQCMKMRRTHRSQKRRQPPIAYHAAQRFGIGRKHLCKRAEGIDEF